MTKRRTSALSADTQLINSQVNTTPNFQKPITGSPVVEANYTAADTPDLSTTPAFSGGSTSTKRNTLFLKEVGPHETTRFSAVFSENQDSFGPVILDAMDYADSAPATTNTNQGLLDGPEDVSGPLIELALDTLLAFPSARTCDILMEGLPYIYDVWLSPTMIRRCLSQVWAEYGTCLGDNRTRESVFRMAKDLFANSKRPRPVGGYDSENTFDCSGWMNWFGGPHLRWEMVGILFTWAGMALRHKPEWDPVFALPEQHGRNRNTAANRMRECAVACGKLYEDYTEISDIVVICMKNSCKLQSIIISDESKSQDLRFAWTDVF